MTTSIDHAAAAFDVALGNTGVTADDHAGKPDSGSPTDSLFGNLGQFTPDGDEFAGGDGQPNPEEKPAKRDPKGKFAKEDDEETGETAEPGDDEETDDENPGADEDTDDEETDDEDDMSREYVVMVDGEEVTVPLKEALEGYQRTEVFHRRMNQLDAAKKELGGFAEQLIRDREVWDARLAEAEELMKSVLPPEPDWDKLYEQDPRQARQLQVQFDALHKRVAEIRGKREAVDKENTERIARENDQFAKAEYQKFAKAVAWPSREAASKDLTDMLAAALAVGFSEEEAAQVVDSRMLTLLLDAAKYRRIKAAKPVAAAKKLTHAGAGTRNDGTARRAVAEAKRNLGRTGSVDDAARFFQQVLKR